MHRLSLSAVLVVILTLGKVLPLSIQLKNDLVVKDNVEDPLDENSFETEVNSFEKQQKQSVVASTKAEISKHKKLSQVCVDAACDESGHTDTKEWAVLKKPTLVDENDPLESDIVNNTSNATTSNISNGMNSSTGSLNSTVLSRTIESTIKAIIGECTDAACLAAPLSSNINDGTISSPSNVASLNSSAFNSTLNKTMSFSGVMLNNTISVKNKTSKFKIAFMKKLAAAKESSEAKQKPLGIMDQLMDEVNNKTLDIEGASLSNNSDISYLSNVNSPDENLGANEKVLSKMNSTDKVENGTNSTIDEEPGRLEKETNSGGNETNSGENETNSGGNETVDILPNFNKNGTLAQNNTFGKSKSSFANKRKPKDHLTALIKKLTNARHQSKELKIPEAQYSNVIQGLPQVDEPDEIVQKSECTNASCSVLGPAEETGEIKKDSDKIIETDKQEAIQKDGGDQDEVAEQKAEMQKEVLEEKEEVQKELATLKKEREQEKNDQSEFAESKKQDSEDIVPENDSKDEEKQKNNKEDKVELETKEKFNSIVKEESERQTKNLTIAGCTDESCTALALSKPEEYKDPDTIAAAAEDERVKKKYEEQEAEKIAIEFESKASDNNSTTNGNNSNEINGDSLFLNITTDNEKATSNTSDVVSLNSTNAVNFLNGTNRLVSSNKTAGTLATLNKTAVGIASLNKTAGPLNNTTKSQGERPAATSLVCTDAACSALLAESKKKIETIISNRTNAMIDILKNYQNKPTEHVEIKSINQKSPVQTSKNTGKKIDNDVTDNIMEVGQNRPKEGAHLLHNSKKLHAPDHPHRHTMMTNNSAEFLSEVLPKYKIYNTRNDASKKDGCTDAACSSDISLPTYAVDEGDDLINEHGNIFEH